MRLFRRMGLVVVALVLLLSISESAQSPNGIVLAQTQAQTQPAAQAKTQAAPATTDSVDVPKLQSDLKTAQDKLKDWPNLGRYHDADAQVEPPATGENRVVFMGDSITDGWGRKYGKFFPGKPYINRGISGQTTPQMLIRFRPDVIALKPKVVVILAGTNDLAGNTGPSNDQGEYERLVYLPATAENDFAPALPSQKVDRISRHKPTAIGAKVTNYANKKEEGSPYTLSELSFPRRRYPHRHVWWSILWFTTQHRTV